MRITLLAAFLGSVAALSAQSPASPQTRPPLAFDVASVKPAAQERTGQAGSPSPARVHFANITLLRLIDFAYDLRPYRSLGAPQWVGSERWEVSARSDRVPAPGERRAMLQHLLAERFGLKAHIETRELPIYTLVLARGDRRLGPNMKPAIVDCEPFRSGQLSLAAPDVPDDVRRRCGVADRLWGGGAVTTYHAGFSTTRLARSLEESVNRVIVDKTGLTGSFDIELTYEDRRFLGSSKPREAPALLTAVQEQLGLRLVASRGPVDVLVIDAVARPMPN